MAFFDRLNMEIAFTKESEQYIYSFILHGSTGIISQWIRSDYAESEACIGAPDIPCLIVREYMGLILNDSDIYVRFP